MSNGKAKDSIKERAEYLDKQLELKNSSSGTLVSILSDESLKQAIARDDSSLNEDIEPTKHTLLNDALVKSVHDERVNHFTKFLDEDEVRQMTEVFDHANLISLVFGHMDGLGHSVLNQAGEETNPRIIARMDRIKIWQKIYRTHGYNHMHNMMSYHGETKTLLGYAVKNESANNPQLDKEVKKMFGGR